MKKSLYLIVLTCLCMFQCKEDKQKMETSETTDTEIFKNTIEENPMRNAYFGDLHVHTSFSLDAFIFGTTNDPNEAYRFGRGEEVEIAGGIKHKLRVPLDFAAVTDHAETFAEVRVIADPDHPAYNSTYAKRIRNNDVDAFIESMTTDNVKKEFFDLDKEKEFKMIESTWQELQKIANKFYEPGKFTTFKAWEYSWARPDQQMLHRNVIFRGNEVTPLALGSFDLPYPEDLWNYLNENCQSECEVLIIPHNPNWSWGYAFSLEKPDDRGQYSTEELKLRARFEKLVEIQQVKGNSEAFIGVGSTDEDADYEQVFTQIGELGETGTMSEGSTVRSGLKRGIQYQDSLGFNPFKVGIIGSTDNHNGVAGDTQEDTYNGHEGTMENQPDERRGNSHTMIAGGIRNNPGGLAGVWAEANTREHIWDALNRRETWGTSGTRISVRFFGSFNFKDDVEYSEKFPEIGYKTGVPMGSDLTSARQGKAPTFVFMAMKDANSGNLDRMQMIKGWVNDEGETEEKVYNVAWSSGREIDANGKLPHVGNTVNLKTAEYSNTIGSPYLKGTWTDPDFNASKNAFYYLRVMEIPTPRYSTFDAIALGLDPLDSDVPATVQERAWSSPIWYTPK